MKDFFNKETLDNIKQFCTENKKYVGVAAILIGLILILIVVVAGGNNGRHSDTESESQTEISVKDFEFEKDYTNDAKDDISTLLADYYKAYVSDDLDTLDTLATPMSDNEKSYIGVVSQYYESVNDITPYTKNGLKKGSYFVSVKNSIKFTGIDSGSTSTDVVILDQDGRIKSTMIIPTGGGAMMSAEKSLEKAVEKAGIAKELGSMDFDDARRNAIEKCAVVCDEYDGRAIFAKERFEPLDRRHVEVVCRLVEQEHIGAFEQNAS